MSTADAFITELRAAPEDLVRETRDFFLFMKSRKASPKPRGKAKVKLPDFAARMKSIFGTALQPDSLTLLNAMRDDRF